MDRTVRRQRSDDLLGGERLEEADAEHPDLLPGRDERVDRLLDRAAGRAHDDDHAIRVGRAVVVDQPVAAAGPRRELVHDVLDDPGDGQVVRVGCLARLEEDIRVLGRAADDGRVRGQTAGPERKDVVVADQRPDVVLIEDGDLVDLVRGPEAVEEMEERDPRPQRGGMRDQREVVRLLDRARREHRPAGRARVHDVAVVAEDREGVRRDRPGRDMDDRRRQLAGDLEHVGDHQEQALRRREGRGQGALLERPVERSGGARLGLHLDDVGDLAPQVGPARGGPVVAMLGHRRGRGDRVDRDHFADGVGDASRRLVPVQALDSAGPRAGLPFGDPVGSASLVGYGPSSRPHPWTAIIRPNASPRAPPRSAGRRRSIDYGRMATFRTPSRRLLKRS